MPSDIRLEDEVVTECDGCGGGEPSTGGLQALTVAYSCHLRPAAQTVMHKAKGGFLESVGTLVFEFRAPLLVFKRPLTSVSLLVPTFTGYLLFCHLNGARDPPTPSVLALKCPFCLN
jgi:hypothetical protein